MIVLRGIHKIHRIIVLAAFILITLSSIPSYAYLRIHPENSHYFQETKTGKPVIFTGFGSIVPTAMDADYRKDIKEFKRNDVTYARVWHFLPWAGDKAIWPWERSNVPGAPMGGNKIDMEKWNPIYWNRMRESMSLADKAGIYAEIHLFDRCGMSPAEPERWGGNPWASDNNINNLETPPASEDGTPEFYQYAVRPNLRAQQERYVKKMIDETIRYPNVIYEIENEHWEDSSPDFAAHYARFVKGYITGRYPKSPRLVSYSSLVNDLEFFYDINDVDIINKHFGDEPERNPDVLNQYIEPRWKNNKAINLDEFANGLKDPDILRKMCWTIVASGGNFHIEDAQPESKPFDAVRNIRRFLKESKWDFVHSAPDRRLITSGDGYCMAQRGREYLAYFPEGGEKRIRLDASAEYSARWWNPRTGRFSKPISVEQTGNEAILQTPDPSDWVLHIKEVDDY